MVLLLFYRKMGLQLQYLQVKAKQKPEAISKFLFFDWSDKALRKQRWEAFLLFPMLYPVELDDEDQALLDIKYKVKRSHIGIYFALIIFIVLSIFSEKVF